MTPQKTTAGASDPLCERYNGAGRCTDPDRICLRRGLGDVCLGPSIRDPAAAQQRDPLNDILVECARIRGCYPLMHRTLHEFDWFCTAAIWGSGRLLVHEIQQIMAQGNIEAAKYLTERRDLENSIRARFNTCYQSGPDELIRLAEAFLAYCREQYSSQEEGAHP